MRHLLAMPILCATLASCATPAAPLPGSFTLAPGQELAVAPDTVLHFDAVDDSRCPPGVQCIWAGRLSYRFAIRRGSEAPETFTLSPGQAAAAPAVLGGGRIVLDDTAIPPAPAPGAAIDYRATFTIVPPDPHSPLPTTP